MRPEPESPPPFTIDPRIEHAWTPPGSFYSDPQWFSRISRRVLGRAWHCLGLSSGLESPGAVRPVRLLPGVLDAELALVRGPDRTLRLLSNVCTHRGMLIVEEEGTVEGLRCRYHGRRWSWDGSLAGAPGFRGVEGFPRPNDDLPSLEVRESDGMIFGSLDPELPFEEWYEPVASRLRGINLGDLVPAPTRHHDYAFEANWMLYLDNYLEAFHIPFIHPGLNAAIPLAEYTTTLLPTGSVQIAGARAGDPASITPPSGHPEAGREIAAWYFWLFPTTLVNVYPWGISLNVIVPLGPTSTRVEFRSLVGDPTLLEEGAGGDLHQVEMEDEAAVIATQRGLGSPLYPRGRYSALEEQGVHHFHRLVLDRCGEDS